MADGVSVPVLRFPQQTTPAQLATALRDTPDLFTLVVDTNTINAVALPEGAVASKFAIVGSDLFLIQPDGTVIALIGGAENSFIIQAAGIPIPSAALQEATEELENWESLSDLPTFNINQLLEGADVLPGSGEQQPVRAGDPLIGLEYSPLLPFTDYPPEDEFDRDHFGGAGGPLADDTLTSIKAAPVIFETDAPVDFRPADFIEFTLSFPDDGEQVTNVELRISRLPDGTTTNIGTISGGTLNFTGSEAEYQQLVVTLPTDFSSQSRIDQEPGPLDAFISIETNFLGSAELDFPIIVVPEGDAEIDDTLPDTVPDETDDPISFKPSDLLVPEVTDIDGSESIDTLELTITGLPGGSTIVGLGIVVPAGAVATISDAISGAATLRITMDAENVADIEAAYASIEITVPADFSTANRSDLNAGTTLPLELQLDIQTDEDFFPNIDTPNDGTVSVSRIVDIGFEHDIEVDGPATLTAEEDGGLPDSDVGVDVDLELEIVIDDQDGSETEDPTDLVFRGTVEIVFDTLPDGTTVNGGIIRGNVWSGTVPEAEALILSLPGNFAGEINGEVTVTTREGSQAITQTITVTPSPDVVITGEIETQETDDDLPIILSDFIDVTISDPAEEIALLEFTLPGLPDGTRAIDGEGNDIGTFTPGAGGTVDLVINFDADTSTFDPNEIRLILPADYSTESPATTLEATLTVTTRQVGILNDPVTETIPITVGAEGDVMIDDTLPDTIPDETDDPTLVTPSELLDVIVTDQDGSESLESLTLTITGLPGGSDLDDLLITVPAGATANLTDGANGSATLVLTMETPAVADIEAAYDAFNLTLPRDFSTANRSDLNDGSTTFPLTFQLDVQTDEDQDPLTDTPTDGTATATRVVEIDFEHDIELTATTLLEAEEDGGPNMSGGVEVPLEVNIVIGDIDDSEDGTTTDAPFGTQVTMTFVSLPPGTRTTDGAGDDIGTLTGNVWTGSVEQANTLALFIPGDENGTILNLITVKTPEGQQSELQVVRIIPTTDTIVDGEIITTETDAPLPVLLSEFINVVIPPDEDFVGLTFTLDNVPTGTEATAAGGVAVGSFTDNGDGTSNFTYTFDGTGPDPRTVSLIFPEDYSTENPELDPGLEANLVVTVDVGGGLTDDLEADIPITINVEGDASVNSDTITLPETDDFVEFTPADTIMPNALDDDDSSESVIEVAVVFNALPDGTQFSINGDGGPFNPATSSLDFVGTPEQYELLVIRLPVDFSTQNPSSTLTAQVAATTDEGGAAVGELTVIVTAEGDVTLTGPGALILSENDAPGIEDEDDTTTAPLDVRVSDAVNADASDADGSESIDHVDLTLNNLPDGALYSLNGGASFVEITTGATLSLTDLSESEYENLIIRLPDDFSTETDITGTATFVTDEAILNGEDGKDPAIPGDGVVAGDFTITVESEQDIAITTEDITVIEDLGEDIPLNIETDVTDIDGSEEITSITVEFTNLPDGDTVLNDGTVLNAGNTTWTGTKAEVEALAVTTLPTHYSGVIDITVTVTSDEGDPAGASETFKLNVTPIAEPVIDLSVDDTPANVDELGPDNYIVDEDTDFLLLIDASTPDQDGSEQLTQVVIENMPAGWLRDGDGEVDLALFEQGQADVASASVTGTTLTITFNAGVTDFDGALRATPLENDDRDVITIVGSDMIATVTSEDMAATLPTDTETATDGVDVDVDAIVDDATFTPADTTVNERVNGRRSIEIDLSGVALEDDDGSETITSLDLTITVATLSDEFDPSNEDDLELRVNGDGPAGVIEITQTGFTDDSVSYSITPVDGATNEEVAQAIEALETVVPQHFSGILTLDGTLSWNETTTGDVEDDTSDNFNTGTFQITQTVNPRAEADLTATVFVLSADEVAEGSPTSISGREFATIDSESVVVDNGEILTLLESTSDGSGPGQVEVYVGLNASTPDGDGSEELSTLVIQNVPTDWVRDISDGTDIDPSAFFNSDGSGSIEAAELAKIDSATYDAGTGELTISFVPDVTGFEGSIQLKPTLYEDYDIDRDNGDRFTSAGDFFAEDLTIVLTSQDGNTATTDEEVADVTLDVDVDPVNNIAFITDFPEGNEGEIDAAGGVWQIPFEPEILDKDGSETVTAVVLKGVPAGITIFVPDLDNPDGPKVVALLTETDPDTGANDWSLERDQWLDAEVREIPLHYAGPVAIEIDVVTTEFDGGNTRITTLDETLYINPVVDGGDPSESEETFEDTAVKVEITGNLIDNPSNSPESPEAILDEIVISNIIADSQGRMPRFFDGDPADGGVEIIPFFEGERGTVTLSSAEASNLWVLPGQDSNEDLLFDISLTYFETIDPLEVLVATGTITVSVRGVADEPILTLQDPDPTNDGAGIDDASINAIFRPTETTPDGIANADRVYGYVGGDNGVFFLTERLTDDVLQSGDLGSADLTEPADPINGMMTEITFDGEFDGSETLYYIITGVDPAISFIGGTPVDATGETYLVPGDQIDSLQFVPVGVSEVTYYDMTINAIVIEDDQPIDELTGSVQDRLDQLEEAVGADVTSADFTVIVLPEGGSGGMDCEEDQELPPPVLSLVGSGDEDTEIAFQLKIEPNPPFYDSIDDLVNLPNGVVGSFGLGIDLPEGATISSDPPGAVLFDPITGLWAIDIGALGVDPGDQTLTAGSILFTPPPHESSPENPFDFDETFGDEDPYDELNQLEYTTILDNITCGTTTQSDGAFEIVINPVVDGPTITFNGTGSFDEDTIYDLGLEVTGVDGGERLVGNIIIEVDSSNGGTLLDVGGNEISGEVDGDITRYTLSADELAGLQLQTREHYSGPLEISVTATSEDIDGSQLSRTETQIIDVIPVADIPEFPIDDSRIDDDTGEPFVEVDGDTVIIKAIEDIPFLLGSVIRPNSPDQDGSEAVTIVLTIDPDYVDAVEVDGPFGPGFIDNGDGSYTASLDSFDTLLSGVSIKLVDEHARLTDEFDPELPAEIPFTLTVNTLELANADQEEATQKLVLRVRPDADEPTVTAIADPTTGEEDSDDRFELTITGTTPDPHEEMRFEITVPEGGIIYVGEDPQTAVDGVVTLASGPGVVGPDGTSLVFSPLGDISFLAPPDFAGDTGLDIVAVTIDTSVDGSFTDTEASDAAVVDLVITPSGDLTLTVDDPDIQLEETDDVVSFSPAAGFTIEVTDTDGSESVDSITYTINGVPDGTTYQVMPDGPVVPVSGDLIFTTDNEEDFTNLQVNFPADFATNDTPLTGSLTVTTDEGGNETGNFTIDVEGTLDLTVTVTPDAPPQTGEVLEIGLGIEAVIDEGADEWETLEEVVVEFSEPDPLPAGTTASAGTISGNTLTLTRGSTSPADFAILVAALSITLPADFAGAIEGNVTISTNHGTADAVGFAVDINDQPVISDEINVETNDTMFTVDLLQNASDDDEPLMVENLMSSDGSITVSDPVDGVVDVTVPDGYVGEVTLTYDVVDSGTPPASTSTQANLDIDTLQMEADGTFDAPDGGTKDLMSDVTGEIGGNDIAKGTTGDDAVILDGTRPYAEIEGFELLGGNDFVDLSGSSNGFTVDLGEGADQVIGSSGNDTLTGGTGIDTLEGGTGADIFVMTDLTASDVISDYERAAEGDQIDLTALVTLAEGEALNAQVTYDSGTGALSVGDDVVATISGSGGLAPDVEVIFNDADGVQTAVI